MPPTNAKWTDEHDRVLLRALIAHVLSSRRALYATPGLEDVSGNGGSRINQRIQLIVRRMGEGIPGIDGKRVVAEEVARANGRVAAPSKRKKRDVKPVLEHDHVDKKCKTEDADADAVYFEDSDEFDFRLIKR